MTQLNVLALLFIAIAVSPAQQPGLSTPDTIFYNGKVVTVDSSFTIQQAFAIKGEEFVVVGANAKIRALAARTTRLVDLHGTTVVPGLSDNHDHLYAVARVMRQAWAASPRSRLQQIASVGGLRRMSPVMQPAALPPTAC
jgi:adenine deaminase